MHLPDDFLLTLRSEDDWTFIIKANVFLEALISHAITVSLQNPKIAPQISRLYMRDKIKWASALELIASDGVRFLEQMSAARNAAAHDISALSFSFSDLFEGLDASQRKSRITALAYFASEEDLRDRWETVEALVLSDTKQSIWWSLLHFAGLMWWKAERAKLEMLEKILRTQIKTTAK